MKILFVASEAAPFVRSGGLGDVAGALPKAFAELGHDARVILPFYKLIIPDKYKNNFRFVGSTYVDLSWRRQYVGGERFAYFSKAVLEVIQLIGFYPDILHCNDWHTALTPVYLDVFYRFAEEFRNIRTVFTIHNIEFQGKYGTELLGDILGLPQWAESLVMNDGCVNFMKGGIECSSAVTTVSETYANEILDPYYSYGLEGILSERRYKLHGVINGIDTKVYDPATDPALFKNYTLRSYGKKKLNKQALCEMLDLPYDENRPLMAMVTRLTEQKGMDLVGAVIDEIMRADIQMVVLGTGDWRYENLVERVQGQYPSKFRGIVQFSSDLASKLYAASDLFLMPSKFEPCGLSQMIAMAYGSVPVVRETGGLKDTVEPFNPVEKTGVGFTFKTYNSYDMLDAVWRAYGTFFDKDNWKAVVSNGMKKNFGWEVSAKKYLDIYAGIR